MSVELQISPLDLLETPPEVFVAMCEYLHERKLRQDNERRRG